MNWFELGIEDARRTWQTGSYCYVPPAAEGTPETIAYGYGYFQETGHWHGQLGQHRGKALALGPNTRRYYARGYNSGIIASMAGKPAVTKRVVELG